MLTEIDAERTLAETGKLIGGEYTIDRDILLHPGFHGEISGNIFIPSEGYRVRMQLEAIAKRALAREESDERETLRQRLHDLGVVFASDE